MFMATEGSLWTYALLLAGLMVLFCCFLVGITPGDPSPPTPTPTLGPSPTPTPTPEPTIDVGDPTANELIETADEAVEGFTDIFDYIKKQNESVKEALGLGGDE